MLSYEQYSRAPKQFEIKELFLVREDLLCDLQQYEQSRNLDQSFRETIHVMRVRGCNDDQLLVQDQKITEVWTNNELNWLIVPNNPACLVVFAVAVAETRGYCPWHPKKDPCTVQKKTEEIDIYAFVNISLGGFLRFNGLCNRNKCIVVSCQNKASKNGLCIMHGTERV